ncbi:MAG: chromosomal replication initiator protein DnaA [Salinisphaera sp.]|nr:chromosomal replication initiator protein DnaA [Salinisphaera sp.]
MTQGLWQLCLTRLEPSLSEKDINLWLRPLQAVATTRGLELLAPNEMVREQVERHYRGVIEKTLGQINGGGSKLRIAVGGGAAAPERHPAPAIRGFRSNLDPRYTFASFVQGKSNQIARAAAEQAADPVNISYNPLLIYGGVGLGKTHLMHGVGNHMLDMDSRAKVVYVRSEHFVNELITALRHNRMDAFKGFYRGVDALLIDDIQFFAGKERSQEEFFHTFNALLETNQRIVLTCDRFPKEVKGLEDRLKSRFSWGLSVAVEPPELETRVAILTAKAEELHAALPQDVAFFIAKRVRSNVRDLESALHRLTATARFSGEEISVEFANRALRDMLAVYDRLVTIEHIQRTVAEYYHIRIHDLHAKKRSRSITRPRQIAMALAKELTRHSLPEIGAAFGGRDHTTVLHACRKINVLRDTDNHIDEDYNNLTRTLSL